MTSVAGLAVVLITGNSLVMRIGICSVVLMAENAFESLKVIGVDMTVVTGAPASLVAARKDREILCIVVPGRWDPGVGIMAHDALSRESRALMIRIGSVIVVALMTGIAVGRGIIEAVRMATLALHR